jgi:predicted nucleic acid-binding protein
VILVDSSA